MDVLAKKEALTNYICNYKKIAVAFSGGVDSTLLLKICIDTLGKDNVLAITANATASPSREISEAGDFCNNNGIKNIAFSFNQLDVDGFCNNPVDRCYICKKALFIKMKEIAKEKGFEHIAEGSNLDDNNDYRPGHRAIEELGILSPLREAELTKIEIRMLSKELNLKTFSKPSMACLATRFVYGDTITKEKLKMVDMAENILADLGFKQSRVRIHQNIARIEILPDDIEKILTVRDRVNDELSKLGFDYITLDLSGYKQGSMNININI